MPTLTSLLARDGIVSLDVIEQALQRQVLEGGELDTALLELGAVEDEDLLARYRAESYDLAPALRAQLDDLESELCDAFPGELARGYQLVPLAKTSTGLVLASAWPLSSDAQQAIADRTAGKIELRIGTELRVLAALERHYGVQLGTRLSRLLERLGGPVRPSTERATGETAVPADEPLREAGPPVRVVQVVKLGTVRSLPSAAVSPNDVVSTRPSRPGLRAMGRLSGAPRGPLTRVRAMDLLEQADDRDRVLDAFFAFARQYFSCTVLFALRDEQLFGLEAYGIPSDFARSLEIPVPSTGTVHAVVLGRTPRIVDLSATPSDLPLVEALGRVGDQPAAILPIAIRRRIVAVLYGDRSGEPMTINELWELLHTLPSVSAAFERIIKLHKLQAVQARRALGRETRAVAKRVPTPAVTRSVAPPPGNAAAPTKSTKLSAGPAVAAAPAVPEVRAPAVPEVRTPHVPEVRAPSPISRTLGYEQRVPRIVTPASPLPQVSPPAEPKVPEVRASSPVSRTIDGKPAPEAPRPSNAAPIPLAAAPSPEPVIDTPKKLDPIAAAVAELGRQPTIQLPVEPVPEQDELEQDELDQDDPEPQHAPPAETAGVYRLAPREQETTRPSRPSKLPPRRHSLTPGAQEPPASRTLSQPPPGAGSYALVTEPEPSPPPPQAQMPRPATPEARDDRRETMPKRPSRRPDPRAESKTPRAAEVVSIPNAIRESLRPRPDAAEAGSAIVLDLAAEANRVLDDLMRAGPDEEKPFTDKLLRIGDAALAPLQARFPGPLWFDRTKPRQRMPAGRDLSAAARALHAFGDAALPYVAELLSAKAAETRLCATLFAADMVRPALLWPLYQRLFDPDGQVRLVATETLPLYRNTSGFGEVLKSLRERAGKESEAVQSRLSAIEALFGLRDPGSVELLAGLCGHRNRQLSVPAHRALVAITGNDFGDSERRWRGWAEKNRGRHRIEWLIDGLMHGDERVRTTAGLELQKLTQVYYGYDPGAGKRDREQAQTRYRNWFLIEGRRLFA